MSRKWILIVILLVAFLLRFYLLTKVPITLNPDEKYNGYLAYSLLKTGRDLDGNFFPIAFKSFGDWSLIGYPLLTTIPVTIWGLSDFSARFIGAISGVITVFLIYRLSQELFGKKRSSLLAALFFAISPWSIYFSRISHEVGLGLLFFLGGLWCFLKFVKTKRYFFLTLSAVILGLSLFTHFAYTIFTTVMVASLFWVFRPPVEKPAVWLAGLLFGVFLFLVVTTIFRGSAHEISDIGLFNNKDIIYARADRYLSDKVYQPGDILAKLHNKFTAVSYQLGQNYIASFSPKFLFDEGGQSQLHNLGYFGWLYQTDFIFLIAGIIFLCWRRERFGFVIIAWLLVAPLASFFTKDHPSSTRLFPMVGALTILSGYGASGLASILKRQTFVKYFSAAIITVACAANFIFFLDFYFIHFNPLRARFIYYGYSQAAEIAKQYPNYKVAMIGPDNFPFISFLFYNHYDPEEFRRQVVYYPQGETIFRFVQSFGRFEFPWTIDRRAALPGVLYFDRTRTTDSRNIIRLPGWEGLFTYYTAADLDLTLANAR